MAKDDLFRRSFEAGTAFLGMTRERAEALVKELVKAGEVQREKTQKAIDDLLERSRKGTEELRQLIRREIAEQVSALGLATKDDLADLERRLEEKEAAAAQAAEAVQAAQGAPAASAKPTKPRKAPPVKKAGGHKDPADATEAETAGSGPSEPPAGS